MAFHMEVTVRVEGVQEALRKLAAVDTEAKSGVKRALYRIGGFWKRITVEQYTPISPTADMLKRLQKNGGSVSARDRRTGSSRTVTLTKFYADRLPMLLSKDARNTNRPMPGGLIKSIGMRSDHEKVEVFVPSNSPGGQYAKKIHDERGRSWRNLGPGSQARGGLVGDKFILRAFTDNQAAIVMEVSNEMSKALQRAQA